jgi:hypothetical protein
MRARIPGVTAVVVCTAFALVPTALSATRCVGSGHGCYRTIQAAHDAARDGDTIKIAPGSFAGGVRITKSVHLRGKGAHATTIRGGGPVVTIGTFEAATQPTVTVTGVKITGGRTGSGLFGTFLAQGGGVLVPPSENFAPGATVAIRNSVITGNRAAPTSTTGPDPGQTDWPACPSGPCPFAGADGGGVDNWGAMTLTDTVVSDNEVGGPVASDAVGAGIWSNLGSLTLVRSKVVRNRAAVVAPNGRFAEAGGMLVAGGALTVRDTLVGDNAVSLASSLPEFAGDVPIELGANTGAINVNDGVPATIERALIAGNKVTASALSGRLLAFDSAMLFGDAPLTMSDTVVTGNRVTSVSKSIPEPGGSTVEADGGGTLTNVHIVGNSSSVTTTDGDAAVAGALAVLDFTGDPKLLQVSKSIVSGNSATATRPGGTANVFGGGVFNNARLDVRNVAVSHNTGRANGTGGAAQGAGIWNGVSITGPPVELSLTNTLITRNGLAGSSGIERHGAGLFTQFPVARTRTVIAGNVPDQCFGCDAEASSGGAFSASRPLNLRPATRSYARDRRGPGSRR